MTVQLMEWSDVALMKERGKGAGEECEVRRLVEEANEPRKGADEYSEKQIGEHLQRFGMIGFDAAIGVST
ncbi:unnamed protein product [Sphagnum jensenii]